MNETFNYLRANGIYTLEDLEHRVSEHSAATESLKKTLDEQTARMKAIKQLYDSQRCIRDRKEEKVLIPSAYLARHGEGVNKNKTFKDGYGWGSSTICNILEKREYLGHTINFKMCIRDRDDAEVQWEGLPRLSGCRR